MSSVHIIPLTAMLIRRIPTHSNQLKSVPGMSNNKGLLALAGFHLILWVIGAISCLSHSQNEMFVGFLVTIGQFPIVLALYMIQNPKTGEPLYIPHEVLFGDLIICCIYLFTLFGLSL